MYMYIHVYIVHVHVQMYTCTVLCDVYTFHRCVHTLYPHIVLDMQEMLECRDKLRCNPPNNYTYHDRVFANKMNHFIQLTDHHYEATMYREALKTGFYDLQVRIILYIHVHVHYVRYSA